jgi:hypothetical protein
MTEEYIITIGDWAWTGDLEPNKGLKFSTAWRKALRFPSEGQARKVGNAYVKYTYDINVLRTPPEEIRYLTMEGEFGEEDV